MTWETGLDNLLRRALEQLDFERFTAELIGSNPVVCGQVVRPTKYVKLTDLERELRIEVYEALKKLRNVTDDADELLEGVQYRITKWLMVEHHHYLIEESQKQSLNRNSVLKEKGLWYPASYHVLRRQTWNLFGERRNYERYATDEFYDVRTEPERHPAIVIQADNDGKTHISVPISHSRGDRCVQIDIHDPRDRRPRYAICSHPIVCGWKMVTSRTLKGTEKLYVNTEDFTKVVAMFRGC